MFGIIQGRGFSAPTPPNAPNDLRWIDGAINLRPTWVRARIAPRYPDNVATDELCVVLRWLGA